MNHRDVRLHITCVLIALLLALAPAAYVAFAINNCELELQLTLPEASWLHLYPDNGGGFLKTNYQSAKYLTPGKPETVRFSLGPRRLYAFQLHIATINGVARVSGIRIINSRLAALIPISPTLFRPELNELLTTTSETLSVKPRPGSSEATVNAIFAAPLLVPASLQETIMATLFAYLQYALLFYCIAFLAGLGILVGLPSAAGGLVKHDRLLRATLASTIFAVILASRLWLINCYGTTLPFWDQWVVEINQLYLPYLDGRFADMDFLGPINGHRLLISRLAMFGLFILKGSFSTQLQMICSALMVSGLAAGFFLAATRLLKGTSCLLLGLFMAILFALPFDWENALWGLTGPQLLLVLSVASIWCVTNFPPASKGWFAGAILGICAIVEMGSGFLVCVAPAVAMLLPGLINRDPGAMKRNLTLFFFWGVIGAANLLLASATIQTAGFKAHSLPIFILALARNLAWPLPFLPWWAVCQWVPFLFLLYYTLSRNSARQEEVGAGVTTFILATGFWVLLQTVALAYGRGATAPSPASRYTDILAVGVLVNITCIFILFKETYYKKVGSIITIITAYCWLSGVVVGITLATVYDLSITIPQKNMTFQAQLENVTEYYHHRNPEALNSKPLYDVPYEDIDYLIPILNSSSIGRIIPELMRQNLAHPK